MKDMFFKYDSSQLKKLFFAYLLVVKRKKIPLWHEHAFILMSFLFSYVPDRKVTQKKSFRNGLNEAFEEDGVMMTSNIAAPYVVWGSQRNELFSSSKLMKWMTW